MNRKGFMMAELVVVSSVIIVTLVGLYSSYNKIYSQYNSILGYYDVTLLYRLGYYRDILKENNILNDNLNNAKTNQNVLIYNKKTSTGSIFTLDNTQRPNDNHNDIVYLIYNNKNKINKSNLSNLHNTFYDYIDYFNNSIKYNEFSYVMIIERCDNTNEDNCKYAYLEIPE